MALIKCEECGHEVSSKAVSCPKCGARVASMPSVPKTELNRELGRKGEVLAVVVAIAAIWLINWFFSQDRPKPTAEVTSQEQSSTASSSDYAEPESSTVPDARDPGAAAHDRGGSGVNTPDVTIPASTLVVAKLGGDPAGKTADLWGIELEGKTVKVTGAMPSGKDSGKGMVVLVLENYLLCVITDTEQRKIAAVAKRGELYDFVGKFDEYDNPHYRFSDCVLTRRE